MSWVTAAGVMENWITCESNLGSTYLSPLTDYRSAYQALSFIGKFSKGESVLVHGQSLPTRKSVDLLFLTLNIVGGASGIGLAVAQLGRLFGG